MVAVEDIANRLSDLLLPLCIYLGINVLNIVILIRIEKIACDRFQNSLYISQRQEALKIIDENQHQHVFLGVALFLRRRQKLIFRIVVDHGLGKDLIIFVPLRVLQMFIHKMGDLIHIQVDIRNITRPDVICICHFI